MQKVGRFSFAVNIFPISGVETTRLGTRIKIRVSLPIDGESKVYRVDASKTKISAVRIRLQYISVANIVDNIRFRLNLLIWLL